MSELSGTRYACPLERLVVLFPAQFLASGYEHERILVLSVELTTVQ